MINIGKETIRLLIFQKALRLSEFAFRDLGRDENRVLKRSEKESVNAFLADVPEFKMYFEYQNNIRYKLYEAFLNNMVTEEEFVNWKNALSEAKGCYYSCKADCEKLEGKLEIAPDEEYLEEELVECNGQVLPRTSYVVKNFEPYRGYTPNGKIEEQFTESEEESESE